MSNSKDSYDNEDNVPISNRFGSVVRPRLDNQQMNALQESVRKQNLGREKINKGQDSDQSEEKSEIVMAVEETDNSLESDVTRENDKIELTEKVANKEGRKENLFQSYHLLV